MIDYHDKHILLIVFALITIGLLAVYSSTSVVIPSDNIEKDTIKSPSLVYFKKQLVAVVIGSIFLFLLSKINLNLIKLSAVPLLVLSLILLLLVFTGLGVTKKGATRWINLEIFHFQPSEFVKLAMIVFLAWYMSRDSFKKDDLKCFLIPIGIMAIFQLIFLLQPDFGATVSLSILTISMLLLGGVRLRYIGSLSLVVLVCFVFLLITKPYRVKRLTAFLNPWEDPLGSGFQLIQSYIALGSGGLTGLGIGESKQKLAFLPEIHTDFIFSLIGEETGLIGALVVVTLFCLLFYKGVVIAWQIKDPFAYYIACGTILMITTQAIINFSVVTGLAPTKGLPLPFISYGGSSLLVGLMAVGLLINASRCNGENSAEKKIADDLCYDSYGMSKESTKKVKNWRKGLGYFECKALLAKKQLPENSS
ncbi:MAG: putative lipid II flippase FtsW [Thermodesulfovibrionales bacterium]|nr:putative lipid II flippase FtsW [Thermodesulfovibrionales bacterium]